MAEIVINNFFIQSNIVNCSENVKKKEEKKNGVFVNRVLEETIKLPYPILRNIWNAFIDESSSYGEDSYVYDSEDYEDLEDLHENIMSEMEFNRILKAVKSKRYFQYVWTSQNHRYDFGFVGLGNCFCDCPYLIQNYKRIDLNFCCMRLWLMIF